MLSHLRASIIFAVVWIGGHAIWLKASGPAGVICIVDKVVFEPNESAPKQIQVWGGFSLSTKTTNIYGSPKVGYMYFKLPETNRAEIALKEWADLKSVAGTGIAVGFGSAWSDTNGKVRGSNDRPRSPDEYNIGSGVVKIEGNQSVPGVASSNGVSGLMTPGGVVDQIRALMKKSR